MLYFTIIAADEEFDELCFEYGLELDEVVSRDQLQLQSQYHFDYLF